MEGALQKVVPLTGTCIFTTVLAYVGAAVAIVRIHESLYSRRIRGTVYDRKVTRTL